MRILIIFLVLINSSAYAVCTPLTRINNAPNTVLTSTKYNADLNAIYSKSNAFPGDCVTANTLPLTALNTSLTGPILSSEILGCAIDYVDGNTLAVKPCKVMVDGIASTSSASTTWTWGQAGDAAEATATTYYIYAKKQAALGLHVSTSAPDDFGYSSTERAIGRFRNNDVGIIYAPNVDSINTLDNIDCTFNASYSIGYVLEPQAGIDNWCINTLTLSAPSTGVIVASFSTSFFNNSNKLASCQATSDTAGNIASTKTTSDSISVYLTDSTGAAVNSGYQVNCKGKR